MKRFLYAILLVVMPAVAATFASCDDDNDLPNVTITASVQNGVIVDGTIYVVQGDTLNVTGLNVKNNESDKGAAVTDVKYYFDGIFIGNSFYSPFPAYNLTNENTPVGTYDLGISCTVIAVDKTLGVGYISYPIKVVANATDIPGDSADQSVDGRISFGGK